MLDTEGYQQHEDLYYPDGNIALVAQWEDPESYVYHVVFRVHKSVLAKSSSVFEDMFSLPASKSTEMYDGVPLVRMTDTGKEIEGLLQYLYSKPLLSLKPYDPNTPLRVRPLLRMADKFQIDALREHIVAQLVSDWPGSLRQWDKLESEIQAREKAAESDIFYDTDDPDIDDQYPEPAAAIRLARDFDIPEILSPAFYHLSRINIEHDWDASRGLDRHGKPTRVASYHRRTARWDLLEKEDYVSVLRGRYRFKEAAVNTLSFSRVSSRSAADKEEYPCLPKCNLEAFSGFWRDLHSDLKTTHDVLATLRVHVEDILSMYDGKICGFCYVHASGHIRACRVKLWERLPEYFELPAPEESASEEPSSEEES
ncbi:hypothetical protein DENSPDRAFT_826677 [Dentipellis sp. KUC8613]|nr:hypothetical protein DENSPDRAFT_826677 [Dentipellis sp. KUC8613]